MRGPAQFNRRAIIAGALVVAAAGVAAAASALDLAGSKPGLRHILPLLPGNGSGDPKARFRMGIAETDITPGRGTPMSGYGWRPRMSNGRCARRLRAQCMVLRDINDRALVMVRVDAVALTREAYLSIVGSLIAEKLIARADDFMINVSHTHSGPALGVHPDPRILTALPDAALPALKASVDTFKRHVIETVRRAHAADPVPVILGHAAGSASVATFRWMPNDTAGPTEVPVIIAQHAETGKLQAVLFGYACHPVCRGNDAVFDADFCGVSATLVSRELGVPALFFQGMAGDVDPARMGKGEVRVSRVGHALGEAVLKTVREASFTRLSGPAKTAIEEIQLPFAVDLSKAEVIADLRLRYLERIAKAPSGKARHAGATKRHAQLMVELIDAGNLPTSIPMTLQCWGLGSLKILTMAHEVVSGYAAAAKAKASGPLWTMGYTNQVECYVPNEYALRGGGYPAGWEAATGRHLPSEAGSIMVYGWPAPLRSALDAGPDRPAASELVMRSIERLLSVA
ncbi:MAG TPA: hypothetical protein DGG94_06785 [Micromonosporaceae bacterium]|nr:hypothetical protein [Micromonosporaceae bacterium]HCU49493.1 hypothetical protein [Micromonosporaceae bacterium]